MIIADVLSVLAQYWALTLCVATVAYILKNYFTNGFHKYPGPKLAAFTDWWRFFDVAKKRHQFTQIKLHQQHGDVVRLGPNTLSFGTHEAAREIYGLGKGYTKTEFYPVQSATMRGQRILSLFSTIDEAAHARYRRCVNHAFSMGTLVSYEPLVNSTLTAFLDQTDRLFASTGAPCSFSQWLQFFAFDVIGELTWSRRLGFVDRNEDVDGIIANLHRFLIYAAPVGQQPWLDYYFGFHSPVRLLAEKYGLVKTGSAAARFAAARNAERDSAATKDASEAILEQFDTEEAVAEAAARSGRGVDFLARFRRAQRDFPDVMTDRRVMATTLSLTIAGSDTTAASLSAVFYLLLRNPRCLALLKHELADAAAAGLIPADPLAGNVSWTAAQKLPYLDACIQESFRLYPAVGLLLERYVPPQGATIAGHHVPGGTIVGCNGWVLHRRPEVFGHDVDVFRPERWTEAAPDRLKEMKAGMFQFGAGARTCIGRNISTLEIYKLVPTFLRRFDVSFVDPTRDWDMENNWFISQQNFDVRFARAY